jgi:6-phosphogluconolactonase
MPLRLVSTVGAAAIGSFASVILFACNNGASAPASSGTPTPTGTPTSTATGTTPQPPPGSGSDASSATDASSPPPSQGGGLDAGQGTDGSTTAGPDAAAPSGRLVAYASGYAPAIQVFSVDPVAGTLTLQKAAGTNSFGDSPSFLAMNPTSTTLYAVDENTQGQVGAYAIDKTSGAMTFLNAVSSGGDGPPFLRVDASGKYVLVANYGDGTVSVLPILAGGKLGAPLSTQQVGTNAHMILPDPSNHFAFVPCLGSDYVAQFTFDPTTGALKPNSVPHVATAAGAGPRHIAFHPNGKLAYLINEVNSTMTAFSFDPVAGTLTEIQTLSTLPAGFTGTNTAAEVWVHPSGNWLFGSNRGNDSIVVFKLDPTTGKMTFKGTTPSGGADPRDFTLDPTGAFLYATNQTGNNLVSFKFDATQGTLTTIGSPFTVTAASFIGLFRLPSP